MTERLQVYKCDVCGNIVELLQSGAGELVCCNQPMTLQQEKTEDATTEKHVPFIEDLGDEFKVRIGQNAAHPMEEKHYIQWIEFVADGKAFRQFLEPGDDPQTLFAKCSQTKCAPPGPVAAREYCNVHGLWKGEKDN